MSMFVELSSKVVNLAHVALASYNVADEMLTVHYSIPEPKKYGSQGAVVSGHLIEELKGEDAKVLWASLRKA